LKDRLIFIEIIGNMELQRKSSGVQNCNDDLGHTCWYLQNQLKDVHIYWTKPLALWIKQKQTQVSY